MSKHELVGRIANDLERYLDEWYSLPEQFDNALDTQIHRWYANVKPTFPKRPYFSPSSAGGCARELYYKQIHGGKGKDKLKKQPHQGRWTAIGTAIGDVIQRDILALERSKEVDAPFKFERTSDGKPMFEDFAKENKEITYKGRTFYLFGTCDGIMEYVDRETGEKVRVGLEVKSKQTTNARTGHYSMREPERKHVDQCHVYGAMYDVDLYVILYVNASKKSWVYSDEEYAKTPDIRAFGIVLDKDVTEGIFDKFVDILERVDEGRPPKLTIDGWTFNNFKTKCVEEMTEIEMEQIESRKDAATASNLPEFKKRNIIEAVDSIREYYDRAKEKE